MASTTASSNLAAGAWFGELASALQGTWQAVAATTGEDPRPARHLQQQQKPARGGNKEAVRGAAAAAQYKKGDVGMCGGAMSDTTVYLLLDRFSPS